MLFGHACRRDVVGDRIIRVVQQRDGGITTLEHFEALAHITGHDVDLSDVDRQQRVQQAFDNARAIHIDQGFRRIDGNRHHPAAKTARKKNGALRAIRLQRSKVGLSCLSRFVSIVECGELFVCKRFHGRILSSFRHKHEMPLAHERHFEC